jgi:hypothetical protein
LRVFEFERRGHLWAVAGKLHGGCCHVQSGWRGKMSIGLARVPSVCST